MKKLLILLMTLIIAAFCFSACSHIPGANLVDKNRDAQGYVQFIADFNTGLFAYTNKPDAEEAYSPANPKLEKTFTYGSQNLEFTADYQENKIVYTAVNPSEDRISEKTTFEDIYNVYYESWNNYAEKTKTGTISANDADDIRSIELTLSGLKYTVTFDPLAQQPSIVYEIITIA